MKTRRRTAAALIFSSVAFSVCGAEVVARATADDVELFTTRNFARSKLSLFDSAYPSAYDATLGWVPRPGYAGRRDNAWKTQVTIDADGYRENGGDAAGPEILAVGDSFTFGDEVDDEDTFPAHLERLLGRRVVNAGVFGYGLDQSVLRAERYLGAHRPSAVVLQAVRDDLVRMQMSKRTGVAKPFFTLPRSETSTRGVLRLEGVPTSPVRPSIDTIGPLRTVLGHSYLVDSLMRRFGHGAWWYVGQWDDAYAYQDLELATEIGCRLVERLGERLMEVGARGVFVAEYASHVLTLSEDDDPYIRPLKTVAACARSAGFEVVDTHVAWRALAKSDPPAFQARYARVHLSSAGNAALAAEVAAHLE